MQTLAYRSHFAYSVIDRLSLRWTEFRRVKGGAIFADTLTWARKDLLMRSLLKSKNASRIVGGGFAVAIAWICFQLGTARISE